jgi:hypothetical protein
MHLISYGVASVKYNITEISFSIKKKRYSGNEEAEYQNRS